MSAELPFEVEVRDDLVVLVDRAYGARCELVPSRGALLSRFDVQDEPVLYLDRATLDDRTKNVRGGIPLLFPFPGRLGGDRWEWGGRSGCLPQHGFARNEPFALMGTHTSDGASATLRLEANDRTRAAYGFEFVLEVTFTLKHRTLRLDVEISNRAVRPERGMIEVMPAAFGVHPYLYVPQAAKGTARVYTNATRAYDAVAKAPITITHPGDANDPPALDFSHGEVDLRLANHSVRSRHVPPGYAAALVWTDRRRVRRTVVSASPEHRNWVLWTLPERDFICVEPWTAPTDALNSGERLFELPPSSSRRLWIEITSDEPSP